VKIKKHIKIKWTWTNILNLVKFEKACNPWKPGSGPNKKKFMNQTKKIKILRTFQSEKNQQLKEHKLNLIEKKQRRMKSQNKTNLKNNPK